MKLETIMNIVAYEELGRQALAERWRALLEDPNAPERCELDEFGEIRVNPPPSFKHQRIVAAFIRQLEAQLGGEAGSYALMTSGGIRFPDICWAPSFDDLAKSGGADPLRTMPPLCIEVLSPGNTRKDTNEKVAAYLQAGVEEVVLVETDARIRFFTSSGEQTTSTFGLQLVLPPGTYPL
jgi:Uma2 family endonuclease